MKDTDIIETLASVGFSISKSEINAIFRSKSHRNYKPCGDQLLRNFLDGLIERERKKSN